MSWIRLVRTLVRSYRHSMAHGMSWPSGNVSCLLVGGIGLASSSPRSRAAPTTAELCSCFCQQVFSYNPVASRDHCQSITTCFSGNGGFMKMFHEYSWVSSLNQVLSRFHLVQLKLPFGTENIRSLFTFKWLHAPWNQGQDDSRSS